MKIIQIYVDETRKGMPYTQISIQSAANVKEDWALAGDHEAEITEILTKWFKSKQDRPKEDWATTKIVEAQTCRCKQ